MSTAVLTRPKPRIAAERTAPTVLDEHYTLPFGLAAQLLGRSADDMHRLVQYSQINAGHGVEGPLQVTANGHSVTLLSVLAYRRVTADSRTA
ncbi:hypothetical protein ABZS76_32995 [Streptomyces sp. NPDC005562]|uniref:hypothetical protein n=1 Tax=Streptomyces sp. NPDC005562 TaxID=3154890 RepID=UPI0033B330CE